MALTCDLMSLCHKQPLLLGALNDVLVLIYIATDICHDHQFSSASLLQGYLETRLF